LVCAIKILAYFENYALFIRSTYCYNQLEKGVRSRNKNIIKDRMCKTCNIALINTKSIVIKKVRRNRQRISTHKCISFLTLLETVNLTLYNKLS